MKRIAMSLCFLLLACVLLLPAGSPSEAAPSLSLLVHPYGFGPGVSGLILHLPERADGIALDDLHIEIMGQERDASSVFLSDAHGLSVNGASDCAVIGLSGRNLMGTCLFALSGGGQKEWIQSCPVSLQGTLRIGDQTVSLSLEEDCAGRIVCPENDLFPERYAWSEVSVNPLTGQEEVQTIRMAASAPEALHGGAPNPLIIFLHGAGEGGKNLDAAVLGNEVSRLAQADIQSHFTSQDGSTGAYVLLPQCETVWMDEGDGLNGKGQGRSRYTETLMNAIQDYLENHPDVDRSRIYLGGCSNGGYMTMHLLCEYPGVFAAAFPVCEALDTDGREDLIEVLSSQSIWFVQSQDDPVVDPER